MRILILSAGAGAGHNRAAEAIDACARELVPEAETRWFDSLKYTSRTFQRLYGDSYVWIVNHSPTTWGLLYRIMGENVERPKLMKAVKMYDKLAYKRLMAEVRSWRPDAVVCTHFLPTNVVLTHLGDEAPPVYVMVTDFDVHSLWINPAATGYFAASEQVAWLLRRFGVPADRIRVTGIPVLPAFSRERGRATVAAELGIDSAKPTVLFMSGGFGMGEMETAYERLARLDRDYQLLVVCGRNEKLRRKLEKRGVPPRVRLHGFVTNVHDFMEASDLVISKSGGLTTSECLARGVPMVVWSPIPGQEERNCDHLMERGAGVKAPSVDVLDYKVLELLDAPDRLASMKAAARRIARPLAGRDVLRHVIERVTP